MRRLRLGTRGSKLALVQAEKVATLLGAERVEIVPIRTSGDRGDREVLGAFVREIQRALLDRTVDIALHCLKDLPTEPVPGLTIGAYLQRDDPRDALIGRTRSLGELPLGSIVGSGSLRRTAQLAAARPDLKFKPLVGNVDTRLSKLLAGEYDAIVLAMAGLDRMGWSSDWASSPYPELYFEPLDLDSMLPAPGQAVLVAEARDDDAAVAAVLAPLDHASTRRASEAERGLLARLGGGCSVPVAAYASATEGGVELRGLVAAPDGSRVLRARAAGMPDEAVSLVYADLAAAGATEILYALPIAAGAAK